VEFRILGPLEVVDDGRPLPLGRGRQRALLGLLVLRANEVVSREWLVDRLWGESPPPTAATALHGHVSRLRRLLGDGRVRTSPPGYALRVEPDELDLHRFEQLMERGRYRAALALWRGPALADLAFEPWAQPEAARLEEKRLCALEGRIGRELDGGRHGDLVGELEALTAAHPFRESFAAQLMLALYRAGRQADALAAYRSTRARLDGELGLEPGEALHRLERQVLVHDPALDVVAPGRRGRATNMPAATTSFVGRVRELGQVRSLLERPGVRLLTLTGAGGTGKTRLALEAVRALAGELADGVWFVPLAATVDAALVPSAIAGALGVQPAQGQSHADAVEHFVRERELLLVLDNLEHLLDAAPFAAGLLAAAPRLSVVATSRVHLNVYGEFEYAVPPLSLPDLDELPLLATLARLDAIRLFVDRAQAVLPGFELTSTNGGAVAQVCARLDGLPLAIELAAARVRTHSIDELVDGLEQRLVLAADGPRDLHARQRTLRDTIRWSYDLLAPAEQELFARLAVFAGGWSSEAAREVCGGGNGLEALLEHSLVRREGDRFTMLETIRELALELLAARGADQAVRSRHADFFLELGERGGPNLRGAEREGWLTAVDRDLENVRAALAWGAGAGDAETGMCLVGALLTFWINRGFLTEGAAAADALLARSSAPTLGRARALLTSGMLGIWASGEFGSVGVRAAEAVELARGLGDRWLVAVSLNLRGTAARLRGDRASALRDYDEALAVAGHGELWWPSMLVRGNLGVTALSERRYADAAEELAVGAGLAQEAREWFWNALLLTLLGRSLARLGELERSGAAQAEALEQFVVLGNAWGMATSFDALANLAGARGDHVAAARLFGAEEEIRRRAGVAFWISVQDDHDAGLRAAADAVGEDAFAHAFAEGAALAPHKAIAYATRVAQLESAVGP
jgi:predicted ATPase/DNA-binding SARP family transcriptional activator